MDAVLSSHGHAIITPTLEAITTAEEQSIRLGFRQKKAPTIMNRFFWNYPVDFHWLV
jgi:hypothetical protein